LKGEFHQVEEDRNADEFELIMDTLTEAGYRQYEVSNFALPGYESVHNSNYWHRVPYLGVGPGAHSFTGEERFFNIASNHQYMASVQAGRLPRTVETLDRTDRINEYLMTSLRLDTGCDLELLDRLYGHRPDEDQLRVIGLLTENGSAKMDNGKLVLTRKGRLIADKITGDLFLDQH